MAFPPPKAPAAPNTYEAEEVKPQEHPSGFKRIKDDDFKQLFLLVTQIQKTLLSTTNTTTQITDGGVNAPEASNTTSDSRAGEITTVNSNAGEGGDNAAADSGGSCYKRQVGMLVTDVEYIKKYIGSLESSGNGKRAEVLLQHLMDAAERRKAEDFPPGSVNLKKLLQIVAKLKLWVPPNRGDLPESEAAGKKVESPFVSSKEKENAATEIVKELFGLRCRQWGLDGLLNSYGELTVTVKNCLLCFSVFQCDVGKDKKTGVLIQKSLVIKKRILIHWWVAEGLIDFHKRENPDLYPIAELNLQEAPNPNPNPTPNLNPIPDPQSDPNQVPKSLGNKEKMTIEKIGDDILKILAEKGFIEPVIKTAQESGSYLMHPFVHSFVTALAKRAGFFDFSDVDGKLTPSFGLSQRACLVKSQDKLSSCQLWAKYTDDRNKLKRFGMVQTLFNVNESIIDIKPEWFSKMRNLTVLHLGSWRSDPVEHIEVEDQKFLEDLKIMKQLRLFSLQGLSTIMKLTNSVCELTNLIILDLRDCHNLEELPSGIGCLKNLTHLDITNCHLLTKLPIGISLLSQLEVLKGFVIYDQAGDQEVKACALCRWWRKAKGCVVHDVFRCKNREVCTLTDLIKLENLRELSLVVNIDDFPKHREVQVFRQMRALHKLKISWERSFKNETIANQRGNKAPEESSTLKNEAGANQGGTEATEESSKKSGWCFPCLKPAVTENVSTRGVGLEAPNADAEQESSAGGVGLESSASGCLNLNCCKPQASEEDAEKSRYELDQIKKLELWCFPHKKAPNWLHSRELKNLEKLYIKGGNLEAIPGDTKENKWVSIKTLRLKYLPNMEISWLDLKAMFPNMTYLEKYECNKLPFFPCDQEGVWRKTKWSN